MFRALADHPCVLTPVLHKGVHYFDLNYHRGPAWYRSHFPLRVTAKRAGRGLGKPAVAFESSPYYLFHPLAAERLARDLPHAKMITLLRDPVERAFSAHAHEFARGYETEAFERALELEPARTAGERDRMVADPAYNSYALQHHAYVGRGEYIDQLERVSASLGRDRLLIVDSHRLFDEPGPVLEEVFDFLELPFRAEVTYDRHNARPRSQMPDRARATLEEHFRPYDERLAAWLGWTPSWMG